MKLVTDKISLKELRQLAEERFGDMVKAVVDLERVIMVIGGELHADEESLLLDEGSEQQNLWGINIYPDKPRDKWIEFDSVINIKPRQNNHSRDVEDLKIKEKIIQLVNNLIQ